VSLAWDCLCTGADQARLYRLIWQRAIASQMANAKIQQVRESPG
jgi:DNA topoisomerase IA